MACECSQASAQTEAERATLRIALALNATMFVVGMAAGLWAQSSGLMADALDMLADASAYALALLAVRRGTAFKRNAARWSGSLLLVLGGGIVLDVVRRGLLGSEPLGLAMMAFSAISLVVNVTVLRMLDPFRHGEVHLRATWIFTRMDVLANLGVFASGLLVWLTGWRAADLVVGLVIGLYVAKEAIEILKEARQQACTTKTTTLR
ncbi:cation diffusion facilitator family transporter [Ralstonia pseudosolanacearum]|uniref:Cation transporter n=1 Tax=Ralstonia solanacearum TaxID=305 RepID=A0AA92EAD4_RALSL|nr:cation diffusion facilitator family transporter [Ralstonia pseudosolanacearum]QCX48248.1 cation transporter [Ralstonia pseudosolanacearum]